MGEARAMRRETLLAAATAAAVTSLLLVLAAPGGDLAAHEYQRQVFLRHGLVLWNNFWYAGHYSFVTYSLAYYPMAALVGINVLTVVSTAGASAAFARLTQRQWGGVTRWSARAFAVVWPVAVVGCAVLPFALGFALALVALVALQQRRRAAFTTASILCLLTSALAFLLLLVVLAGTAIAHRSSWRSWRRLALGVLALLLAEVAALRLFPDGGHYPFWTEDFIGTMVLCAVGVALCWRLERAAVLRGMFIAYGGLTVLAFIIPSDLGDNIARLRFVLVPIAVAVLALRSWRPRPVAVLVLGFACYWNIAPIAAVMASAAGDPSASPGFWRPALTYVRAHLSPSYRVEVVDTVDHWPAVYLPTAGVPIARGWFRQQDYPHNERLYDAPLGPQEYLGWLRQTGVAFVLLPHAPLDFGGTAEARLLGSGASTLTPVFTDDHVTVYAVPSPAPIVAGPGPAAVLELDENALVLNVGQPGEYRLAVRYSRYLRATDACLSPALDGMTTMLARTSGRVRVTFSVSGRTLVAAFAGRPPPSCAVDLDPAADG